MDLKGSGLPELIAQVSRVSRLREVRALTGFTRVFPSLGDKEVAVAPLTESVEPIWLPAVEVLGEGVFVRLNAALLERWATSEFALSRSRELMRSQVQLGQNSMTDEAGISPRTLALHSLAHVLLDEMPLTSGYPSSSLRERVYDEPGQAGLLIYTATADSAGSLGGLATLERQAPLRENPRQRHRTFTMVHRRPRLHRVDRERRERDEPRRLPRLSPGSRDQLRTIQPQPRPCHPCRNSRNPRHRRPLFGIRENRSRSPPVRSAGPEESSAYTCIEIGFGHGDQRVVGRGQ